MTRLDRHYWGATSGAARKSSGNLAPVKFRNGKNARCRAAQGGAIALWIAPAQLRGHRAIDCTRHGWRGALGARQCVALRSLRGEPDHDQSARQKCAFERLVPVERHVDRARLEESGELFDESAAERHSPQLAKRRAEDLVAMHARVLVKQAVHCGSAVQGRERPGGRAAKRVQSRAQRCRP